MAEPNKKHEENVALRRQYLEAEAMRDQAAADGRKRAVVRYQRDMDDALSKFLAANHGLVHRAVSKFDRRGNGNIWRDDYDSEASLQMWKLFHTWDPELGTFATYVGRHLEGKVRRHVRKFENSMVSDTDFENRPAVLAAVRRIEDQIALEVKAGKPHRAVTDAEVAEVVGLSERVVRRMRGQLSPDSLNAPVDEDGRSALDTVAQTLGSDTSEEFDIDALVESLGKEMGPLAAIALFHTKVRGMSNAAVANLLGGTGERIRARLDNEIKRITAERAARNEQLVDA